MQAPKHMRNIVSMLTIIFLRSKFHCKRQYCHAATSLPQPCSCTPNNQNHKAASLSALSSYLKEAVVAYETRLAIDPEEKGAVVAGADGHPLSRDNQLQPFASLEPDKLPHGPCRAVHRDSHPHGTVSETVAYARLFS
eukprot:scaffold150441_cov20-Prasinocladus_malaysianus.AAC.1